MVVTTRLTVVGSIVGLTLIAACARESPPEEPVEVLWSADTLTSREIELGRRDSSWRQAVTLDHRFVVKAALDTVAIPESWRDIGTIAEADSVWDVRFLSERLAPGTPVEFRDTQFKEGIPAAEDSTTGD